MSNGHPQGSPRGLFNQSAFTVTDGYYHDTYSNNTAVLDANTTGAKVAGGIEFADAATALPGDVQYNGLRWIVNSTGQCGVAINTTGTTWRYLSVTSVLGT